MSVSVVACLYGDGYERFLPAWLDAISALNNPAGEIIISTDRDYVIHGARVIVSDCTWRHQQAYYQQAAFAAASSEWVWKLDIDDLAFPDALDGIENVDADVWQMGYVRTDGLRHVPPQLTAAEYLTSGGNPFVSSSAVRQEAFRRCGGYPDVAFEDWGLWRRLAHAGCRFESSGRPHFRYAQGPYTRSTVELVAAARPRHVKEMLASERY